MEQAHYHLCVMKMLTTTVVAMSTTAMSTESPNFKELRGGEESLGGGGELAGASICMPSSGSCSPGSAAFSFDAGRSSSNMVVTIKSKTELAEFLFLLVFDDVLSSSNGTLLTTPSSPFSSIPAKASSASVEPIEASDSCLLALIRLAKLGVCSIAMGAGSISSIARNSLTSMWPSLRASAVTAFG
eukprot:CAMPEP_0180507942 /NCGR_PEP_ID=MMETSP1036_2-20121128/48891_1 /TAXON_ID=632150 /ORGANISM="Azadinium spinosum, Strain 3D9" /LENGTH=185 /DNA_ID=CAMNT_0022518183 /DNA_START=156 /DNA_END=709 /DNA_ORIENTATION=+